MATKGVHKATPAKHTPRTARRAKAATKGAAKPSPDETSRKKPAARPGTRKLAKPAPTKAAATKLAAKAERPDQVTRHRHDAVLLALRAFGLSYPGAHLKSPWPEHLDLAVKGKTFAYLSLEGEPLRISCKLPHSCQAALDLAFTTPTGYGLGKSGWVTATFKDDDDPPLEFLETWLDESYRAQAPKSLSKGLPPRA